MEALDDFALRRGHDEENRIGRDVDIQTANSEFLGWRISPESRDWITPGPLHERSIRGDRDCLAASYRKNGEPNSVRADGDDLNLTICWGALQHCRGCDHSAWQDKGRGRCR